MKASDLGITTEEKRALKTVRDGLASGRYKHVVNEDFGHPDRSKRRIFNMASTCESHSCGTVACIGGWVAKEMGMDMGQADSYVIAAGHSLSKLYFPSTDFSWNRIKPKQAAQAIDNFLKTGEPNWNAVVAA